MSKEHRLRIVSDSFQDEKRQNDLVFDAPLIFGYDEFVSGGNFEA